jgi:hypothetical protein
VQQLILDFDLETDMAVRVSGFPEGRRRGGPRKRDAGEQGGTPEGVPVGGVVRWGGVETPEGSGLHLQPSELPRLAEDGGEEGGEAGEGGDTRRHRLAPGVALGEAPRTIWKRIHTKRKHSLRRTQNDGPPSRKADKLNIPKLVRTEQEIAWSRYRRGDLQALSGYADSVRSPELSAVVRKWVESNTGDLCV